MTQHSRLVSHIGYQFNDPAILECALTHRSAHRNHNERLEFIGDAVLNQIISIALYRRFPDASEGDLSRLRAKLVKGETLALIAKRLELGDFIYLGSGELKSGGFRRQSILADAMEAIVGAIYLDGGQAAAEKAVLHLYHDYLANSSLMHELKDPKTQLQELLQSQGEELPNYQIVQTHGQPHNQVFEVVCHVSLLKSPVQGKGNSRRKAEQAAAEQALRLLTER